MNPLTITIFGDLFMKPELFTRAFADVIPNDSHITSLTLDWPVRPFQNAYGVRECIGDPEELTPYLAHTDILINHMAPLTDSMLAQAPALKLIAVPRGGPVNVDLAAVKRYGIPLINTPGRNYSAVAELTVSLMIAAPRGIAKGHKQLTQGTWQSDLYRYDHLNNELSAMTVGLIGCGHIGKAVIAMLQPFGSRVLVYDPYITALEAGELVGLETLLAEADVISLHARVTPESHHIINASSLKLMKPSAYLINTARGELIDYPALYTALSTGALGGAALDTFDPEPPSHDNPLLKLPNVTLTPHIAGASRQSAERSATMIAEELSRFLHGEPLRYALT